MVLVRIIRCGTRPGTTFFGFERRSIVFLTFGVFLLKVGSVTVSPEFIILFNVVTHGLIILVVVVVVILLGRV